MIERVIIPNRSLDQLPSETQSRINIPVYQSFDMNDHQYGQLKSYVDDMQRVKKKFKLALEKLIHEQNLQLHNQSNIPKQIYIFPAPVEQQCYQLYVQFKQQEEFEEKQPQKSILKLPQIQKDRPHVMHSLDSKLQYNNLGMDQFSQQMDLPMFGLRQPTIPYQPMFNQVAPYPPFIPCNSQSIEPYAFNRNRRFVCNSYDPAIHNTSFFGQPQEIAPFRGAHRQETQKQDREEQFIYPYLQEKESFVQPQRSSYFPVQPFNRINNEQIIRFQTSNKNQQEKQLEPQNNKNVKQQSSSEQMSSSEQEEKVWIDKGSLNKNQIQTNKQQQNCEEQIKKKTEHNSINVLKQKKISKLNDTKNITKNYSKAIISYIIQNKDLGMRILDKDTSTYEEFISMLKQKKNQMTNIKELRNLWTNKVEDPKIQEFNRAFRTISKYFIQHQSIGYVYNSRISNASWHLKYRYNLLRALNDPQSFKYIKDI